MPLCYSALGDLDALRWLRWPWRGNAEGLDTMSRRNHGCVWEGVKAKDPGAHYSDLGEIRWP